MSLIFDRRRHAAPRVRERAVAGIGIAAVCVLATATAIAAASPADSTDEADRVALVAEGRALYRGSMSFAHAPMLHGMVLPRTLGTCASCHGARGEGGTEAGVAVPAIQWQRLTQATSLRPAYAGDAEVMTALTESRAGDGRNLQAPMPRFALSVKEQRALTAYLRVLGTESDPVSGVDGQRIVLGSVLPLTTKAGVAIREALLRRIDGVNAAGGLFGRRLVLVTVDAGPGDASAASAVAELARSGRIFALVASLVPAPDADLRKTLATTDTAMVATLGVSVSPSSDARVSWLLPSLAEQARALAAEMQRACPTGTEGATRVLYLSSSSLGPATIDLPGAHWQAVTDAAGLRNALHAPSSARTIALLPAALVASARAELRAANRAAPPVCFGTLAALSGEADGEGSDLRELVALPMPPVPLAEGANSRTALWSLLADSAIAVMAEALARAGRQLDTAKMLAALDTVHRFETQPGVVVDFSRRRRHGLEVSYLWK